MEITRNPTHVIHHGAHIKVETKSGKGFAWATVLSDFEAALQPDSFQSNEKKDRGMLLFLATSGFTVSYPKHDYSEIDYDPFTRIRAFIHPQDKTVVEIDGQQVVKMTEQESWVQGEFP